MSIVSEENKKWSEQFVCDFNEQEAFIIFAFAINERNEIIVCSRTDIELPTENLKNILRQMVAQMDSKH